MVVNVFLKALILLTVFIHNPRMLVVGDSLSKYKYGYQDQIQHRLEIDVNNIAQGGKTTTWMLSTLKSKLAIDSSFQSVIIYGGMNDAFNNSIPLSKTIKNIQQMVDLCNSKGILPIVIVGYDARTSMKHSEYYNDSIYIPCSKKYIQIQSEIPKIKNCLIVPVCPFVESDLGDGIHPNVDGHKKLSNWICQHLSGFKVKL